MLLNQRRLTISGGKEEASDKTLDLSDIFVYLLRITSVVLP